LQHLSQSINLIYFPPPHKNTTPEKFVLGPGTVVHTCNHSYSGDRDKADQGSRPAWAKSYLDPPISTNKVGMVVYICNPSFVGGKSRRIGLRLDVSKNRRFYLKNN
jgi:hypothetical protein